MIDFHCHLDLYPEPERVARECRDRGLYVLSVTTTPSAWSGTSRLAHKGIRTALGLHPQLARARRGELSLFDELLPRTRYVGEVGLDRTDELRGHWSDQVEVFHHVLAACAGAGGRIMSIHSRRASGAVLDSIEAHPGAGIPVLHWFSGGARDLERAIELGCWFSVGPAMLRGVRGRSLAGRIPPERVLTESDGPFARIGGRAVLPWDVGQAVGVLANLWAAKPAEVEGILVGNLRDLCKRLGGEAGSDSTSWVGW